MLLLFDIDGTLLLRAYREHRQALHAALHEVLGIADPEHAGVEAAGRTDAEIARHIALLSGISSEHFDDSVDDLRAVACREYAERCPDDLSALVAPGIPPVLAGLAESGGDVRLSLVTGNYEPIARLKLARAGIGHHFPSGQGGFGSDSEDRSALPGIARRRAAYDGVAYPRERTIVIGDTPRDIACAQADGVRCLAVATGPFPVEALSDADVVARDASELGRLLQDELARA